MLLWFLILAIAAICCATLFYAWRAAPVNASASDSLADHYRAVLADIESDCAQARLSPDQADAARAELAREIARQRQEAGKQDKNAPRAVKRWMAPLSLCAILAVSLVVYAQIGRPGLEAAPLAARSSPASDADILNALGRLEEQLARNPEDLEGWRVVAPVYLHMGRFEQAIHAFRRILALSRPSADAETDLAEALMMAEGGDTPAEAVNLLQSAAARDVGHIRSRLYLAGEAMRLGAFEEARKRWREILALAKGDEPWIGVARQGLATAEQGLQADGPAPFDAGQQKNIAAMVEGLATRLAKEGGSLEEWTMLVRAYLVMGDKDLAQKAYDGAKAAYPEADEREALDRFAAANGLE